MQNAAIELISKILNYYAQLETSSSSNVDDNDEMSQFDSTKNPDNKAKQNKFYTVLYKKLHDMSISSTDKVSVNTIFRAGIQYPMFISNKEIFSCALNLLRKVTAKQRNLLFNTISSFTIDIVDRIVNKKSKNLVNDKTQYLGKILMIIHTYMIYIIPYTN